MKLIKCTLLIFIAVFAIACGQQTGGPTANTSNANTNKPTAPTAAPTSKSEVAMAEDLYTVNCMTCHKDSGKGGKVTVEGKELEPDDLTSAKMKAKTDEKLYGYISDGVEDEGMPAFKNKLTKEEISMLVAHLRTLQSK